MKLRTSDGASLLPAKTSCTWVRGQGWDYEFEQDGTLAAVLSKVTELQLAGYARISYEPTGTGLWRVRASSDNHPDSPGQPTDPNEQGEIYWEITGPSAEEGLNKCYAARNLAADEVAFYYEEAAKECAEKMAGEPSLVLAKADLATYQARYVSHGLALFNLFMSSYRSVRVPKWGFKKNVSYPSSVGINLDKAAELMGYGLTKIWTTAQIIAYESSMPSWLRVNLNNSSTWLKENFVFGAVTGGGRITASVEFTEQTNPTGLYETVS